MLQLKKEHYHLNSRASRRLIVRETAQDASRFVADLIILRLKAFKPTPSRPYYVLGLPTGSSPEIIYALLVQAYKAGEISFRNVVTFNMVVLRVAFSTKHCIYSKC